MQNIKQKNKEKKRKNKNKIEMSRKWKFRSNLFVSRLEIEIGDPIKFYFWKIHVQNECNFLFCEFVWSWNLDLFSIWIMRRTFHFMSHFDGLFSIFFCSVCFSFEIQSEQIELFDLILFRMRENQLVISIRKECICDCNCNWRALHQLALSHLKHVTINQILLHKTVKWIRLFRSINHCFAH